MNIGIRYAKSASVSGNWGDGLEGAYSDWVATFEPARGPCGGLGCQGGGPDIYIKFTDGFKLYVGKANRELVDRMARDRNRSAEWATRVLATCTDLRRFLQKASP